MARRKWTIEKKKLCKKTKDQATRTPLRPEGELMCSGSVSSSFYTSGNSRVTLDTSLYNIESLVCLQCCLSGLNY
jgi:hypothetical protein